MPDHSARASTPFVLEDDVEQREPHALDERRFEVLFRALYADLCRFAASYVRDRQAVEDLVQEAFLEVWRRRDRWSAQDDLRAYLFKTVRNRALNEQRRARRTPGGTEALVHLEPGRHQTPDTALEDQELAGVVPQVVEQMPVRCREVFTLSRHRGLTYAEIAEVLGISVKTVETHMTRALHVLRARLQAYR